MTSDIKPLKILQASAGSGKTFSLTVQYLSLLFSGVDKYKEILAITFTNKATAEMKHRILHVLKAFAEGNNSPEISHYRAALVQHNPALDKDLRPTAAAIYRRILHDYSRFAVCTIDSFILQVIRGFAFELNLQSDFQVEMDRDKIIGFLMEKFNEEIGSNAGLLSFLMELIEEKMANNESWNYENDLRSATEIIFSEGFDHFEKHLSGSEAFVFSELVKKYAAESKQFIAKFNQGLEELIDAIAAALNSYQIPVEAYVGKSRSPLSGIAIRQQAPKLETLIKISGYSDYKDCFKIAGYEDCFKLLQPLITQLKNHLKHLPEYVFRESSIKRLPYLYFLENMVSFLKTYRDETDTIHISDTIKLVRGITEEAGDNPSFIWEKTGSKYKHFLWDEFQDTSSKQWSTLKGLFKNALASSSGNAVEHLIVGDVKQAIYRFRNGDWRILHKQVSDDIGAAYILQDSLLENYRSCKNIIAFNNAMFAEIASVIQTEVNKFAADAPGISQTDERLDDMIVSLYSKIVQQPPKNCRGGGLIKVKEVESESYKEAAIAEMVFEMKALLEGGFPLKEIAVLVNQNSEAVKVINQLMKEGIPVISSQALVIAANTSVKLLINTFRLLTTAPQNAAYYKSHCLLHYANLKDMAVSGDDYLRCATDGITALNGLLPNAVIDHFDSYRRLPVYELTEVLISDYGLSEVAGQTPFLLAFRDLVDNAGCLDIPGFLNWWEEEGVKATLPANEETNAVNVMTIHKSKGLAFGAVFIPFMDQPLKSRKGSFWVPTADTPFKEIGYFPFNLQEKLKGSLIGKFYLEEIAYQYIDALNAFYVAATRAKNYLYFSPKKKKTSTITNIGDVFLLALAKCKDDDGFTLGDSFPAFESAGENSLHFKSIAYTPRLSGLLNTKEERNYRFVLNVEAAGKRGLELHEILASVNNEAELQALISEKEREGSYLPEDLTRIREEALKVLQHPALQKLFDKAEKIVSERGIISSDGKTLRPDKVIFKQEEVIVLDYKFTLNEEPHHQHQVAGYRSLLQQMGYNKVSACLFYARSQHLKFV